MRALAWLSIATPVSVLFSEPKIPQCDVDLILASPPCSFSALQRAENSSMRRGVAIESHASAVSVLFSEPKIPQSAQGTSTHARRVRVSVLFSEPKIPQFSPSTIRKSSGACFSALQRAENSSILRYGQNQHDDFGFQCSSASRKFLNPDPRTCVHPYFRPR